MDNNNNEASRSGWGKLLTTLGKREKVGDLYEEVANSSSIPSHYYGRDHCKRCNLVWMHEYQKKYGGGVLRPPLSKYQVPSSGDTGPK